MNITKNEKAILQGAIESEYGDQSVKGGGATWTFSAIEHSGLTGKVASGVISSLVKKGLAIVGDSGEEDGEGEPLTTFDITDLGRVYLEYLPTMTWNAKRKGYDLEIVELATEGYEPLPIVKQDFTQNREIGIRWMEDGMKELAQKITKHNLCDTCIVTGKECDTAKKEYEDDFGVVECSAYKRFSEKNLCTV